MIEMHRQLALRAMAAALNWEMVFATPFPFRQDMGDPFSHAFMYLMVGIAIT